MKTVYYVLNNHEYETHLRVPTRSDYTLIGVLLSLWFAYTLHMGYLFFSHLWTASKDIMLFGGFAYGFCFLFCIALFAWPVSGSVESLIWQPLQLAKTYKEALAVLNQYEFSYEALQDIQRLYRKEQHLDAVCNYGLSKDKLEAVAQSWKTLKRY